MEKGVAPSIIAARSQRWNSGRLLNMSATVSPRLTPRPANPPARASTRSRISPQVMETASPLVRTAVAVHHDPRGRCRQAARGGRARAIVGGDLPRERRQRPRPAVHRDDAVAGMEHAGGRLPLLHPVDAVAGLLGPVDD